MNRPYRTRGVMIFIAFVTAYSLAGAVPFRAAGTRPVEMPLVWVLSTGGTIAGQGASSTSLSDYTSGSILGEDLVKSVPEIKQYANVKVEQLFNVSSSDLTLGNWLTLAKRINRIFADD